MDPTRGGEAVGLDTYGGCAAVQSNKATLTWSKIHQEMQKSCHPNNLKPIRGVQMAFNEFLESTVQNMDPLMTAIVQR